MKCFTPATRSVVLALCSMIALPTLGSGQSLKTGNKPEGTIKVVASNGIDTDPQNNQGPTTVNKKAEASPASAFGSGTDWDSINADIHAAAKVGAKKSPSASSDVLVTSTSTYKGDKDKKAKLVLETDLNNVMTDAKQITVAVSASVDGLTNSKVEVTYTITPNTTNPDKVDIKGGSNSKTIDSGKNSGKLEEKGTEFVFPRSATEHDYKVSFHVVVTTDVESHALLNVESRLKIKH
jgi:hypothetical protein